MVGWSRCGLECVSQIKRVGASQEDGSSLSLGGGQPKEGWPLQSFGAPFVSTSDTHSGVYLCSREGGRWRQEEHGA